MANITVEGCAETEDGVVLVVKTKASLISRGLLVSGKFVPGADWTPEEVIDHAITIPWAAIPNRMLDYGLSTSLDAIRAILRETYMRINALSAGAETAPKATRAIQAIRQMGGLRKDVVVAFKADVIDCLAAMGVTDTVA